MINVADQARPLSQQQHGADAASAKALNTLAQLVMDVGGRDHGPVAFGAGSIRNAVEDSPPACPQEPANLCWDFLRRLRLGIFFGTITITRNPP